MTAIAFLSGAPGPLELLLLFVVILVLFGPKRLPEIARTIGKTLDELRRASQDFKDQVMRIDEEEPSRSTVDIHVQELADTDGDEDTVESDAPAAPSPKGDKRDDLVG